ncbi:unnamed protein product [Candidula unifasciata]|uniref:Adipokinetic hormone n=1 Tax=Candidula unifasciata TaxID=100452 RepID=A0A8S4A098_9EUPU|nr:unnamed protein product [Candidula unifasciata]
MKSSCVFSLLVLIVACLTSLCHGQIHYTPDWGHGKRSLASQFVDSGSDSMAPCLEQTELNLLLEVAKILTREAKKLSNCLKDCPSLE